METLVPVFFACVIGFSHAFEADHLMAVGNIVTKRDNTLLAIKDGVFWGLGHASTILLVGLLMIGGKVAIPEPAFHYFEAGVGLMLVVMGFFRLEKLRRTESGHSSGHPHPHGETGKHGMAYGVGAVHGLAGSGATVLLVMAQIKTVGSGIAYLALFGAGSVVGMLLAAGLLSLPFSRRFTSSAVLQTVLTVVSSLLCIGYGGTVIYHNLFA